MSQRPQAASCSALAASRTNGALSERCCLPGGGNRPRPRVGGLGGAAGALLRAAGALPRRNKPAPRVGVIKQPEKQEMSDFIFTPEAAAGTTQAAPAILREKLLTVEEFVAGVPKRSEVAKPAVPHHEESEETKPGSRPEPEAQASTPATPQQEAEVLKPMTPPKEEVEVAKPATPREEEAKALPSDTAAAAEAMTSPEPAVDAAEFLEFCLGGPAAVLEAEVERAAEEDFKDAEDLNGSFSSAAECHMFSMDLNQSGSNIGDTDSEADEEGGDLEDMFDFDPTKVAELMNKGAEIEEITEHLESAYADAFERRLGLREQSEEAAAKDNDCCDDASRPQLGDLEEMMTPEEVTPMVTPKGSVEKPVGEDIAICAQRALDTNRKSMQDRSRRSLAVQQRPSAAHRGSAAVKAMEAFGRKSIAQAEGEEKALLEGAVQDAVRRASKRHRRSVTKAVEVLEEAADALDVSVDDWCDEQMDSKVELVQSAMDEAYRRHRCKITEAVGEVVAGDKTQVPKAEVSTAPVPKAEPAQDLTVEARIRAAVSTAYERQRGFSATGDCYSDWWGHAGPEQQGSYEAYNGGACHAYSGAGAYQGYDDSAYYQDNSNTMYYQQSSESEPLQQDACGNWNMQPQGWYADSSNQQWYADTSGQSWCEQSTGGYGPGAKTTSWDASSNGFLQQAHYSWGSG